MDFKLVSIDEEAGGGKEDSHPRSQKSGKLFHSHLSEFVPLEVGDIASDHQKAIPRIARDSRLTDLIEQALRQVPTSHDLYCHDAREIDFIEPESVHLAVTSPPYWTLKEYRQGDGQMGYIEDYETFLSELDRVWKSVYDALVPGGRLIIVVGDVCLSRRKNNGRHIVVPLHASIQEHCRDIGFDNLQGIFWHKIANASYEVSGAGGFLGKPYEPNAVIKNDVEYILMQRKHGGYRSPDIATRMMSIISVENDQKWFRRTWSDITGASTRDHPAPCPVGLAERLIRMFSFAGDTVIDPFMGTGGTTLGAIRCGRNSIGIEVDSGYFESTLKRVHAESNDIFSQVSITAHG